MTTSNTSYDANSGCYSITSDIKEQLSYLDPNGMYIVCKCCEMFGRVVDKNMSNFHNEYGKIKLRRPYIVIGRWKDHLTIRSHVASKEKYQQMMDDKKEPDPKKRKNPIPSAIASPTITNFFVAKKKKSKNTDNHKSNGPFVPTVTSKPLPLYRTKCNGVFSLHEVMNTNKHTLWKRNQLLQDGLKV